MSLMKLIEGYSGVESENEENEGVDDDDPMKAAEREGTTTSDKISSTSITGTGKNGLECGTGLTGGKIVIGRTDTPDLSTSVIVEGDAENEVKPVNGSSHVDGEEQHFPSLDPCNAMLEDNDLQNEGSPESQPPRLVPEKEGLLSPRPLSFLSSLGLTRKRTEGATTRSRSSSTCSPDICDLSQEVAGTSRADVRDSGRRRLRFNQERKQADTTNDLNPLKCQVCSKTFAFPYKLEIHMRLHTGERPFKCPESNCDKAYVDKPNLQLHINKAHGKKSQSSNHLKPVTPPKITLRSSKSVTPVITTTKEPASVKKQKENNQDEEEDCGTHPILTLPKDHPFICPFCLISFRKNVSLINHLNVHIPLNGSTTKPATVTFPKEQVVSHQKTTPSVTKTKRTWSDSDSAEKQSKIAVSGKTCPICKKTCRVPSELQVHMRYHTGAKPFLCSICNNRFRRKDQWKNHMRNIHKMKGELQVPVIDKEEVPAEPPPSLKFGEVLRRPCVVKLARCDGDDVAVQERNPASPPSHSNQQKRARNGNSPSTTAGRSQHPPQNPVLRPNPKEPVRKIRTCRKVGIFFKCLQCSNRYTRKETLVNHIRMEHTTTTERLTCNICNKTFKWKQSLRKHLKRHSIPVGVKPFECPRCHVGFLWEGSLRRHTQKRCPFNRKESC